MRDRIYRVEHETVYRYAKPVRFLEHRLLYRPRSSHEFDVLALLAQHAGTVFARNEIFAHVWREGQDENSSAIVVEHVRRLRRAVESDPRHPRLIQTVQRRGYRFNLGALAAS